MDIQKILSKTKPWPLESLKSELRRKSYAIFNFDDENYFLKNTLLLSRFHGLFWGLKLDLAVPTYQKYISMLSHDSGDIKNVENELITKKIQAFELRRFLQFSISFSIIILPQNCLRETPLSWLFFFMIGSIWVRSVVLWNQDLPTSFSNQLAVRRIDL